MELTTEGIVVIVGNYGSGKTEVSINLAAVRKQSGLDVSVADLDLVNPYFRTREAKKALRHIGINLILPDEKYLQADLPVLTPLVGGIIRNPSELTIIDVGGDDSGATVLSALKDSFKNKSFKMLQVINPSRPFTNTIEGCLKIRDEIEAASRMKITGFIGNANLIDETDVENINTGYIFVKELSNKANLPIEFITVPAGLQSDIDYNRFSCPVLRINRQLVPPWKKGDEL